MSTIEKIQANIPEIKLETCQRAFYNISFDPEKRGQYYYDSYYAFAYEIANEVRKAGEAGTDKMKEKAIWLEEYYLNKWYELFSDYINKTSRCMSSAITGPANFPTIRAEKRNNYRDNAMRTMHDFQDSLKARIKKAMLKTFTTKERAEMELEAKLNKVKELEELAELSKELNKLVRKASKNLDLLEDPNFMAEVPVNLRSAFRECALRNEPVARGFELTSYRNKIKLAKQGIDKLKAQIEALGQQGEDELDPIKVSDTFSYLKNVAEDRLQLFFSFKPEEEIRTLLKKSGFKWSPRFKAWQRQLTNNALYAFETFVLKNEDFKIAIGSAA